MAGCTPSVGQAADDPVHVSALSQAPLAARQMVPGLSRLLAGHDLVSPSQVSAGSQLPAEVRQTVTAEATLSEGQAVEVPLQVSAASHTPLAARQVEPAFTAPQVPLTAAPAAIEQAWQSLVLLPPQALLQHTPSTQKPVPHWPVVVHFLPVVPLQVLLRMYAEPELLPRSSL